jgi:hypothetical protein
MNIQIQSRRTHTGRFRKLHACILAGLLFFALFVPFYSNGTVPAGFAEKSDVFSVRVDGLEVFTAKEYCFGDSIFHTSQFFVEGETEIEIVCTEPIKNFEIRPFYKKIKGEVQGNQLRFKVAQPEMLMITVNSFKPLCLFQTPPEKNIPDAKDPKVIYFAKGVHESGLISPKSGQTIYLEQGALVKGHIYAEGIHNVTIKGRGIIDARGYTSIGNKDNTKLTSRGIIDARGYTDKPKGILGIEFKNSKNILIEGIGVRTGEWWQIQFLLCTNVEVKYMNLMSFGENNDGFRTDGVTNFKASNCFIGCGDDGFSASARDAEANGEPPTENFVAEDCVIYNAHAGNGLRIGASMETQLFRNFTFKNICVLICANSGIRSDYSDWATSENITFENFFIEKPGKKGAINLKIEKTRYSNNTGFRDERGNINGLNFINVQTNGGQIILHGHDKEHAIRNVTFRNCLVNGRPLKKEDVELNEYVYDLRIKND